jgi:plasmid stability protein
MAGNLHVRNLDEDLIAGLKRRAARHGRSTEAEHREILRQPLHGRLGIVIRNDGRFEGLVIFSISQSRSPL